MEQPWGYVDVRRRLGRVTYDRVLNEFGRVRGGKAAARRLYRQFVNAGLDGSPESPWGRAECGLVVGSERFVEEVRNRVHHRKRDPSVPQLAALRARPGLDRIVSATAAQVGSSASDLVSCWRADDGSRAVAAHVARSRYGYATREVAAALGYRSHGGVVRDANWTRHPHQHPRKTALCQVSRVDPLSTPASTTRFGSPDLTARVSQSKANIAT